MNRLIVILILLSTITIVAYDQSPDSMDSPRNEAATQIQLLKEDGWIITDSIEERINELYQQISEGSEYFIGHYDYVIPDSITDKEIKEEMENRLYMSILYCLEEYLVFGDDTFRKDINLSKMEECIMNILDEAFPQIVANPFIVLKAKAEDRRIFNYYLLSPEKINTIINNINKRYNASVQ